MHHILIEAWIAVMEPQDLVSVSKHISSMFSHVSASGLEGCKSQELCLWRHGIDHMVSQSNTSACSLLLLSWKRGKAKTVGKNGVRHVQASKSAPTREAKNFHGSNRWRFYVSIVSVFYYVLVTEFELSLGLGIKISTTSWLILTACSISQL